MNTITAAQTVLHQTPVRIDNGGIKNPGATAYYLNVPVEALPAKCKLTRTNFGFLIEGQLDDCRYRGQAIDGTPNGHFRSVMLSFVKQSEPEPLH